MTTNLEQAQAALAQAEEALCGHEQQNRKLRAERAGLVQLGPAHAGDVPAHAKRLAIVDAEISACDGAIRLARAQVEEARQHLGRNEQAIGMAKGSVISLQHAADECDRLAARARETAAGWQSQGEQKRAELANARAALAGLLGAGVEALDEVLVEVVPAPSAEPAQLLPRPHLVPSPRLVMEYGVRRYYDDTNGQEVAADGSALAG